MNAMLRIKVHPMLKSERHPTKPQGNIQVFWRTKQAQTSFPRIVKYTWLQQRRQNKSIAKFETKQERLRIYQYCRTFWRWIIGSFGNAAGYFFGGYLLFDFQTFGDTTLGNLEINVFDSIPQHHRENESLHVQPQMESFSKTRMTAVSSRES